MTLHNHKEKISELYDVLSPYFHSLWGAHIHHGYWIRGNETRETAQIQLIERLVEAAGISSGSRILDVGCGMGASSIYLAKQYEAEATGITISPIQMEMANRAAAGEHLSAKFILMDAEAMEFGELFDVVWSVESISHYQDKRRFFASAAALLKPGGTLAIIDWFKNSNLSQRDHEKFIRPIDKGMLVEMQTMEDYENLITSNGLKVVRTEIMNGHCGKSWDIGLDIVKNKMLWKLAAKNGFAFVNFLKTFKAMRAGFASRNFILGLLVAKSSPS
ncbi:MAG: class I SAM-dependent methyltransferase [Candidatus Acidiferrales bacterium]